MDNSKWLRYVKRHEPHIVGEFENAHGERFVLYRNKTGDIPYITGDELGWQTGVWLLWNTKDFMFSADERDQIARILWPTWDERMDEAGQLAAMFQALPEDERPNTDEEMTEFVRKHRRRIKPTPVKQASKSGGRK